MDKKKSTLKNDDEKRIFDIANNKVKNQKKMDNDIAMITSGISKMNKMQARRWRNYAKLRKMIKCSQKLLKTRKNGFKNKEKSIAEGNWFKIVIPDSSEFENNFIIGSLIQHIYPNTFIPIMCKKVGLATVFHVDNQKTADELLKCDKKISLSPHNGTTMKIEVHQDFPQCEIDDMLIKKVKTALVKRYVKENNAIDLSQFYHDPELVEDYLCTLVRPSIFRTVINLVADAVPHLEALNLDKNKLNYLDKLNILTSKFPNLKILHIGDNKIKEIRQLDVLSKLNLQELRLEGNPLCDKYKNERDKYISDVRIRFPKLLRLDGQVLPKPIVFDVADDEMYKLPPSLLVCSSDLKALEIVQAFMKQYYIIYDSDSRQPLLDAYHKEATFSLTVVPSPTLSRFAGYLPENRNLLKVKELPKRTRLLKQGKLPVVSCLSELPKTQHLLQSFTIDIGIVSKYLMMIVVTGLFKERESTNQRNRFFNRTFLIAPEVTGFLITNDQLTLCQTYT